MNINPLLDYIARYESGGDYNIVWSGIRKADHPPKKLTEMTIGEVLDWQDSIDARYMSEAAGRYQVMEDTLRGVVDEMGLSRNQKYDEGTQDSIAIHLLRRRGLRAYLAGEILAEKFANSIAKEWAGMPLVTGPKRGRSYYAGDGLNRTHAKPDEFLKAVIAVKQPNKPFYRPDVEPPEQGGGLSKSPTLIARIIDAIRRIFGR
jgi:hypothetical protein